MMSIGELTPDVWGKDQDGNLISRDDFKGRKVALYFYPKDMTPGCTIQAKDLNENLSELKEKGFSIVGVSADSAKRHCRFIEKHGLSFPLIADEDKVLIQAFGVWGKKKFMGREFMGIRRTTFIINENGKVERVIEKVKTKQHSQQILDGDVN